MGGMKVVFRSGKATITEGASGEMPFDCFTGGGKVVFYKAGSFTPFLLRLRHQQRRNPADATRCDQENGQLTKFLRAACLRGRHMSSKPPKSCRRTGVPARLPSK